MTAPVSRTSPSHAARLAGIDSLRFWLALWVYFSHFGFLPLAAWIGKTTASRAILTGLSNNLFNGAAAVIGFFVISGLCIHFPYRARPVELLPFYLRRYIRILVPLGVALALSQGMGNDRNAFYSSILWSLVAEEIYYAIYPLLKFGINKLGWKAMLSGSYAAALILIATHPHALNYHEFGPRLTWIVGLPCWLLGCHLAETAQTVNLPEPSSRKIWAWRLSMGALGSAAGILRFHAGIGYPITLTLMGPLLYYWLRLELGRKKRIGAFEYAGKFSYSIYLMHGLAISVLGVMGFAAGDTAAASIARLGFALGFSYLFFLLIERPSHNFARRAGAAIAAWRKRQRASAVAEAAES